MHLMNEYQERCRDTANYPQATPSEAFSYLGMGLAGEAGEVANILKKFLRGDFELDEAMKKRIASELGDCLWYIAELATQLKIPLECVGKQNITKLAERKALGTIKGDGEGNRITHRWTL